ncbi:transient receptor potential cation channel subfamily A member 1 isoform X2 [Nematostella vectensis]|uniref:transient receptor potential cation channel subfamily A member 1 isoform X2 n=1 Tax=Nematostella vectensis TaxID=45351 RepID=UPI00139017F8|nr:transient receptor potential cation channel subfamily A member 1 isoform X2 [Nematostella vectensis]
MDNRRRKVRPKIAPGDRSKLRPPSPKQRRSNGRRKSEASDAQGINSLSKSESSIPSLVLKRRSSFKDVPSLLSSDNDFQGPRVQTYSVLENNDSDEEEEPGSSQETTASGKDSQTTLQDPKLKSKDEITKSANKALLVYFAKLSSSIDLCDKVNFEYLQSLLDKGADVNTRDKHGQTILHEAARSWGVDTARFLIQKGANINAPDVYGRCPLHSACIADYPEMVQYLLDSGADVNAATVTEDQTALHYIARVDAKRCAKILLASGADIEQQDYKNRTPLLIAAEYNSEETARVLLEEGASPVSQDSSGHQTMTSLIQKMPNVALKALDYFHYIDRSRRKHYFYINYLDRTTPESKDKDAASTHAQTALSAVVEGGYHELVMHPVFQKLIDVKWIRFGRKQAWLEIIPNALLTLLYTILAVTYPSDITQYYSNITKTWWRVVLEVFILLLIGNEIRKEITEIYSSRKTTNLWKSKRIEELRRDLEFCHPKHPQETLHIEQEIRRTRRVGKRYFKDKWNYFDWVAYVMVVLVFCVHYTNTVLKSEVFNNAFISVMAFSVIVLWIRLLKYARPFPNQGPFVVMLDPIIKESAKWLFLFAMFFIPYAAAFWMIFGGQSDHPIEEYSDVFDNALAVATIERAALMQSLETFASKNSIRQYRYLLRVECCPLECDYQKIDTDEDREQKQEEKLSLMFGIIRDRFGGKKVGSKKKSDFEKVVDHLEFVRQAQAEMQLSVNRLLQKEVKDPEEFTNSVLKSLKDIRSVQESNTAMLKAMSERLDQLENVYEMVNAITADRGNNGRQNEEEEHEGPGTEGDNRTEFLSNTNKKAAWDDTVEDL